VIAQLVGLERRTARSGRDSIDHAPGGHDDLSNVIAGVCSLLLSGAGSYDRSLNWVSGGELDYGTTRRNAFIASGGRVR
jgi:hypothetical protein